MKYPIELPKEQKRLIIMSSLPTDLVCPDCEETVHFNRPPEKNFKHCKTTMIKWVKGIPAIGGNNNGNRKDVKRTSGKSSID